MFTAQLTPLRRCAIYTRKSTNKRLEHDVNSLVTQREINSAYIKSQRYKGWVELPCRHNDGGHSGSGLDPPRHLPGSCRTSSPMRSMSSWSTRSIA